MARVDDPAPLRHFRAIASALGADPDEAFRRAVELAEEKPDEVADASTIYLRVLAEIDKPECGACEFGGRVIHITEKCPVHGDRGWTAEIDPADELHND